MGRAVLAHIEALHFNAKSADILRAAADVALIHDRGMRLAAQLVAQGAVALMQPHYRGYESGLLESTVRARKRGRLAWVVQMGNQLTPYAGWWEFGGSTKSPRGGGGQREFVKEGRSLYPSLAAQTDLLKRIQALTFRRIERAIERGG